MLAAQVIPNIAWAQAQPAPPLSGVLGKVQSFTGSSVDVAIPSGVVHVTVSQPLATYKQTPSDLSHVVSTSYVGVASVQHMLDLKRRNVVVGPSISREVGAMLRRPPSGQEQGGYNLKYLIAVVVEQLGTCPGTRPTTADLMTYLPTWRRSPTVSDLRRSSSPHFAP